MAAVTWGTAAVAKLLSLTTRRVNQLALDGIIPRVGRAEFEVIPVVQAYVRFLHDAGRTDPATTDARQRLLNARARTAEVHADLQDGRALPTADVERAWLAMAETMRIRMLAVPSIAAAPAHSAASLSEVSAILTAAVHDALDHLSQTPIYSVVPDREHLDDAPGADLDDAADEADHFAVG